MNITWPYLFKFSLAAECSFHLDPVTIDIICDSLVVSYEKTIHIRYH